MSGTLSAGADSVPDVVVLPRSLLVLVLLFALPVLELWVFVQVSQAIGFLMALALTVVLSIGGLAVVRLQGLLVLRRFRRTLASGEVPADEIADGVLLLVAGVLLVVPGFVTAALGGLLCLPPLRIGVRSLLLRRVRRNSTVQVVTATYDRTERRPGVSGVIDVAESAPPSDEGPGPSIGT
jgi:UPF0716 protein FxsA